MTRIVLSLLLLFILQSCNYNKNLKREGDVLLFRNGFLKGYILMQNNCINKTYQTGEQVDSIAIIEANKILDKIYK